MATQGTRRALRSEEKSHEEVSAGPRPFWSGTITFGLVSVPVNLYPAIRYGGVRTRLLTPDGTPVARRYFCPKDEKDVARDEIVRGYEVAEDEYVVVTDEELEALAPRKSRDIDLRRFVDAAGLDPFLFDRAYVLTPGGESHKAYRLLADVMQRENKAGIATFVMRDKEYLVAILSIDGLLRAETLRFSDEVRTPQRVGLPEAPKSDPKLVSMFEHVLRKVQKADVARSELGDERTKALQELVERKRRAKEDIIEAPRAVREDDADEEEESSDVDLLEAIRRSLRASGKQGAAEHKRSKPAASRARTKPAASRARKTRTAGKAKAR